MNTSGMLIGTLAACAVAAGVTAATGAEGEDSSDPGAPCLYGQEMAQVEPGWKRQRVINLVQGLTPRMDRRVLDRSDSDDRTFRVQLVEGAGLCEGAGAITVGYERNVVDGHKGAFRVVKIRFLRL
jgi:hypothetical protein